MRLFKLKGFAELLNQLNSTQGTIVMTAHAWDSVWQKVQSSLLQYKYVGKNQFVLFYFRFQKNGATIFEKYGTHMNLRNFVNLIFQLNCVHTTSAITERACSTVWGIVQSIVALCAYMEISSEKDGSFIHMELYDSSSNVLRAAPIM